MVGLEILGANHCALLSELASDVCEVIRHENANLWTCPVSSLVLFIASNDPTHRLLRLPFLTQILVVIGSALLPEHTYIVSEASGLTAVTSTSLLYHLPLFR